MGRARGRRVASDPEVARSARPGATDPGWRSTGVTAGGSPAGALDLLGLVRRRWFSILLVVAIGVGGVVAGTLLVPREHRATTEVLFESTAAAEAIETRSTNTGVLQRSLDNLAGLARGDEVRERVADALDRPPSALPSPAVTTTSGADVVVLGIRHADAGTAVEMADAWAVALLDVARDDALDQIDEAIAGLEERRDEAATDGRDARVAGLEAGIVDLEIERELTANGVGRVLTAARADGSASPPLVRNLVFGGAAAVFLAIAVAVARDGADRRIRRPADLRRLGLHVLGTLPDTRRDGADGEPALRTLRHPTSPLADESHRIRAALAATPGTSTAIAIVGAGAGVGRTTVATNLVAAFARTGERAALVEADLRHPSIAGLVGIDPAPGVVQWLDRTAGLADIAQPIGPDGVEVVALPAGRRSADGAGRLGGHGFGSLLASLDEEADRIVIDTPPLDDTADATAVVAQADAVVLVVRIGHRRGDELAEHVEAIERAGGRFVGVIAVDARRRRRSLRARASHYQAEQYGPTHPDPTPRR